MTGSRAQRTDFSQVKWLLALRRQSGNVRSQHLSCCVLETRTKPCQVPGIMEYGTLCQWKKILKN